MFGRIKLSRLKFGRSREIVTQEILERMKLDDRSIRSQSAEGNIPQLQDESMSPPAEPIQPATPVANPNQVVEPMTSPTNSPTPNPPATPTAAANQGDPSSQPPQV